MLFGTIISVFLIDFEGNRAERLLIDNTLPRIRGVITSIWETEVESENGLVLGYDFLATDPSVGEITGTSFGTNYKLNVGDSVFVRHVKDEIDIAKIEGLDAYLGGEFKYVFLLLPLWGLILIFRSFKT